MGREEYLPPVGFASEPAAELRRWIGRIILFAFVIFIGWLLVTKVINPPADTPIPSGFESTLPAPI